MPKSEDKYVEKVFYLTELHFSEVTSFKIGTLMYLPHSQVKDQFVFYIIIGSGVD